MLLGYRELESQGYNPTTPGNDLRFTKPYEGSYMESDKAGATEAYFQSCCIDYDCAEDIYRASSNMANHQSAAEAELQRQILHAARQTEERKGKKKIYARRARCFKQDYGALTVVNLSVNL